MFPKKENTQCSVTVCSILCTCFVRTSVQQVGVVLCVQGEGVVWCSVVRMERDVIMINGVMKKSEPGPGEGHVMRCKNDF